jgi:hypothetical protein
MCLTCPTEYIPSRLPSHFVHLATFSTGIVKLQLAEHTLAEGGDKVVAFQLLGNGEAVDMETLFPVDVLAVSVTKSEVAEACGCAGAFVVIDTGMRSVSKFIEYSHDQPAATSYAPNSTASSNHMVFMFVRDNDFQANLVGKSVSEGFTYQRSLSVKYGLHRKSIRPRQYLRTTAAVSY